MSATIINGDGSALQTKMLSAKTSYNLHLFLCVYSICHVEIVRTTMKENRRLPISFSYNTFDYCNNASSMRC